MQGNRDNIDSMAGGSQKVLMQVMKLIDMHDLYGSVAYPKKHAQSDISDIYRLPFATRGIFTNVALQEPFGLTVIEVSTKQCITSCQGSSRSLFLCSSMPAFDNAWQMMMLRMLLKPPPLAQPRTSPLSWCGILFSRAMALPHACLWPFSCGPLPPRAHLPAPLGFRVYG